MKSYLLTNNGPHRRNCDLRLIVLLGLFLSASGLFAESFPEPKLLLRMATYNMHGGKGHNTGTNGTPMENLNAFKLLLRGEQILCFQEVDDWALVQSVFSDFPNTYYTENKTTKPFSNGTTAIAIVSKLPITSTDCELIQTDPGGDLWQRNAQHVQIRFAEDRLLHVFHFHNTYNWNYDDFEYEQSGMMKFRSYVFDRLNIDENAINNITNAVNTAANVVMLGDYNLLDHPSNANYSDNLPSIILPTYEHVSNSRDHLNTPTPLRSSGTYATYSLNISDHNAVWAVLDLAVEPKVLGTSSSNSVPSLPLK